MKVDRLRQVIKEREHIEEISQGEWTEGIEACWKEEVDILAENVDDTIMFLESNCTANEFAWISEILDDLIERTRSREIILCYENLQLKFPQEYKEGNIAYSIAAAKDLLEEALNEQN